MKCFNFFDILLVILMVFSISLITFLCINNNKLRNEMQRMKKQNEIELNRIVNRSITPKTITYEFPSIHDDEVVYVLNRPLPTIEIR